jgi:hypothetical protein
LDLQVDQVGFWKLPKQVWVFLKVISQTCHPFLRQKTIVYEAPFDSCDREQDYATAWQAFEQRLGGAMIGHPK